MAEDRQALEERYRKAVEHKNNGEYDIAIPEFEELAALDPQWADLQLTLGLTYGFVGRFDESIAALKRAVQLDPESVDARLNLAKTFAMLGDYEQARQHFEAVLALRPDHAEAKKQLSYFSQQIPGGPGQAAAQTPEADSDPGSN